MPEVISNTSPIQYLHFLGLLDLLPTLCATIVIPGAVELELRAGRDRGIDLPDPKRLSWIQIRTPVSARVLSLVTDLGPGETEALALALESPGSLVILDDLAARRAAVGLGLRLTGTLGLLLDGKKAGKISALRPLLDRLNELGFRLHSQTRTSILRRAGESLSAE